MMFNSASKLYFIFKLTDRRAGWVFN